MKKSFKQLFIVFLFSLVVLIHSNIVFQDLLRIMQAEMY